MYKKNRTQNGLKKENKEETNKDIMDFFVFDENENNIIIEPEKIKKEKEEEEEKEKEKEKEKEEEEDEEEEDKEEAEKENKIKVKYKVASYITAFKRPDLYSPFGIISGRKYKLKRNLEENEIKKDKDKESSSSSDEKDEKECNEKIKIVKVNRYYNSLDYDISLKCDICGQIGHRKDNCLNYNLKFCCLCLSSLHDDKNCDLVKCFKCNKFGHKAPKCPFIFDQLTKCQRCKSANHIDRECLMKPMEYSHKLLKKNMLTCFICGNSNHVLCSLIEREFPEIIKENYRNIYKELLLSNKIDGENITLDETDKDGNEKDKNKNKKKKELKNDKKKKKKKKRRKIKKIKTKKNIFEDLKNEDIKFTIFCSLCGGRHRYEECKQYNNSKYKKRFGEKRKKSSKSFLLKKRSYNRNNNKNNESNNKELNNFNFW